MHKALLRRWCDAMLKYQLHDTGDTRLDGGLLCPACMRVHGRSADAILPLVTQWQTDGDERCLHAAEKLFAWSANMRRPDGSMNNDTNSNWNGITVFYANALGETLLWYGDKLPAADRDAWTARFAEMAEYLCQNIERIGGNVNYPITCAYTMALAARLLGGEPFAAKAKQLADFAVTHITADGLLYGEGHPMTAVTPKNCRPVDLGYSAEESLPALILYAELTGDEDVGRAVLRTAREHLNFMLPDGGWDNSFGSRSYKWCWWGSRTSDGCLAGFAALSRHDPVFAAAVQKNLELLNRCTHDGLLYGGPMYRTAGEPACIHHTFCHAKSVAALVHDGCQFPAALPRLPAETAVGTRYYPTIDTVKLINGKRKVVTESRLPNIFFAHGTEEQLKLFVYDNVNLPFLRFYYHHTHIGSRIEKTPLIVPDYQMESLKIACASEEDDVIIVSGEIQKFEKGQLVRVVKGEFEGFMGIVARHKGQQRVGIVVDNLLTVLTAYVPSAYCEVVEDKQK